MADQIFDRLLGRIKLFATLDQLFLLCRETVVLLECLFVDVLVLLQGLIDLAEPLLDLYLHDGC